MKIPNKLKIGGHLYAVVKVPKNDLQSESVGCAATSSNKISISLDQTHDQQEATLIHEILHAINATIDHTLLDSLAEQIYQVLKDNKMLRP